MGQLEMYDWIMSFTITKTDKIAGLRQDCLNYFTLI